ncbi:zinc finger protein [Cinnamomum micranthum f. kanehirae]|uniref:Zinc finger protein n=1 Tax=Cinnamomum micranthum f. kanehirae TaxID=337451 RepID=A0A3S3NXK7_9MAGN|nr:zinc finger protein [Cinnamomum micranthum f. kanehirae]
MADAINAIGPGYKVPSYNDLREKIIGKIVEVNDFMEHYMSCWSQTKCSVVANGWTNERQSALINFLCNYKKCSSIFKIFDKIVLLVGLDNIVQFITDNDATYKAVGKRAVEKYGTFYWTACAAHCIDLMLEDMAKPDLFPVNACTIERAWKVTKVHLE